MNSCNCNLMMRAMIAGAEEVIRNESCLSVLDGYIGDGDHGVTAARGFRSAIEALNQLKHPSMDALYLTAGAALARDMGGAIGPIFGGIFTGASSAFAGSGCSLYEYASGMKMALQYVKNIGGAKEGDHTLIDALSPYSTSLLLSAGAGLSFEEALRLASAAAEAGAESTTGMKAAKGRAKFLGDKSIGFRDAGASSFTLYVTGFARVILSHSTCINSIIGGDKLEENNE